MYYSYVCEEEHEPENINVDADSDDEAMNKMIDKAQAHFAEKHPDSKMRDEELAGYIRSRWTKS